MTEDLLRRLEILVEGAKYDVSCSSSGSSRSSRPDMIGKPHFGGLCHSFTPDGRCISLLKILMSNKCVYNCAYCVNRVTSDVERASISPQEIADITMEFYRRNYIEGLFLSSAVDGTPDETMEKMVEAVMLLRNVYKFNGYIHLKAIAGASSALLARAARYVDRMSANIELPTEKSLRLLAPNKKKENILSSMSLMRDEYMETRENKKAHLIPAGQTTQLIVGATPETDSHIINLSEALYRKYSLKRIYFSAYVPVVTGNKLLPTTPPNMARENRLYQADWLMRYYNFSAHEILPVGNLPLDIDPKTNWALEHIDKFPIDINTASYDMLMRVPGIGVKSAWKIVNARRHTLLRFDDMVRMRLVLRRAIHFITCNGKYYGSTLEPTQLRALLSSENGVQLSMFDNYNGGDEYDNLSI